jgi:hypothetical protein
LLIESIPTPVAIPLAVIAEDAVLRGENNQDEINTNIKDDMI